MSTIPTGDNGIGLPDLGLEIQKGEIDGYRVIHKFGHNDAVGATYAPVSDSGVYQTPTTAQSLELISSDANDTSAGTGARTVTVHGLDSDFNEITEDVITNGITAVALTNTYIRVHRMYVKGSGTYATQVAGSHVGTLTLRNSGAGVTWATVGVDGLPLGQSEIGAFTVPAGHTAFLRSLHIHVDSGKTVDVVAFQRCCADVVTAPFDAMRTWGQYHGITGDSDLHPTAPWSGFPEKSDVGFLARVATGTASVLVDFEIWLINNRKI